MHPTPVTFDNLGEETPTDNPQTSQTQETSQAQEFGSGFAESPLDESTTEDMRPAGEADDLPAGRRGSACLPATDYQMRTRLSGSSHMALSGVTSNAR